jgi:predicted metal-dependent hydrolase
VFPDGTVRVTVPRWGSRKEAVAFVERERVWIENQRRRLLERRARARDGCNLSRGFTGPDGQRLTVTQLVERAKRELVPRLNELAQIHNLTVSRVSVRNQRSRWGSCSPQGHICLNWRLIALPDWVRDYVLVHELMHLKRMDHTRRFWKLVGRAYPDYQLARRYLRDHWAALLPLTESGDRDEPEPRT